MATVFVFESLKRGLNNNILKIAEKYARKNIHKKTLKTIFKTIAGSKPSKGAIIELNKILDASDRDKDGKVTLNDLIRYLNQEYGTFQYQNGKGTHILA